MKIIKILPYIIIVLILMEGFAYVNILTSEKYEIDLQQTLNKIEGKTEISQRMEVRKIELEKQKKRTIIELEVLSIVLLILLIVIFYNSPKNKLFN